MESRTCGFGGMKEEVELENEMLLALGLAVAAVIDAVSLFLIRASVLFSASCSLSF